MNILSTVVGKFKKIRSISIRIINPGIAAGGILIIAAIFGNKLRIQKLYKLSR